jgi:hypothetical protein
MAMPRVAGSGVARLAVRELATARGTEAGLAARGWAVAELARVMAG